MREGGREVRDRLVECIAKFKVGKGGREVHNRMAKHITESEVGEGRGEGDRLIKS